MSKRNRNKGIRKRTENQPAKQQADVVSSGSVGMVSASWKGPLPPPEVLRSFEEIVPGAAGRILDMAERQSDHRIQMEKTAIVGDSRRSYLGLAAAFILSSAIIGGGIYLIINDHDWAGVSLIGLDVVGLAAVFLYGTKSRRAERDRKSERASQPSK